VVTSEKPSKVENILESFVMVVILLVLVQTFLEDFAVIMGWGENTTQVLMFSGFGFDLFFTLEFLTRFYNALSRRKAMDYMVHERGWIDFLASVPLLIFSSGPPVASYFLSGTAVIGVGGFLNILKIIKAIRVARILRLLRILKLFRNIKYTDSRMAQRHLAKIITISVTVVVFSLFGYSILSEYVEAINPDAPIKQRTARVGELLEERSLTPAELPSRIPLMDEDVLIVKARGKTVYTRYSQGYYDDQFGSGDYTVLESGDWMIFMDWRQANEDRALRQAWQTLFFFCIVILILVCYLILYSPHFAITVTDPIHVMLKGLRDRDYNLEVKIPERYSEDDVFQLGERYNEVYLPMKDLQQDAEEEASSLQIDDISDILE
jgi:hypothetical protein